MSEEKYDTTPNTSQPRKKHSGGNTESDPESYSLLFYLVLGYDLGKGMYFGLTFPLEDSAHIEELRALSNKYIEFKDGVVKMGMRQGLSLQSYISFHLS